MCVCSMSINTACPHTCTVIAAIGFNIAAVDGEAAPLQRTARAASTTAANACTNGICPVSFWICRMSRNISALYCNFPTVFVVAAANARALARKAGVEMPIAQAAYEVLYEGRDVHGVVADLMTRAKRSEHDESWEPLAQ